MPLWNFPNSLDLEYVLIFATAMKLLRDKSLYLTLLCCKENGEKVQVNFKSAIPRTNRASKVEGIARSGSANHFWVMKIKKKKKEKNTRPLQSFSELSWTPG